MLLEDNPPIAFDRIDDPDNDGIHRRIGESGHGTRRRTPDKQHCLTGAGSDRVQGDHRLRTITAALIEDEEQFIALQSGDFLAGDDRSNDCDDVHVAMKAPLQRMQHRKRSQGIARGPVCCGRFQPLRRIMRRILRRRAATF